MSNQSLGQLGEEYACQYLKVKGYKILERNWRSKLGEIDIIAKDRGTICFVEVKSRQSSYYGAPFEAVQYAKQYKMLKLGLAYLKYKFRTVEITARFDVISVYCMHKERPRVEHIKNAFDLSYLSI